MIPKSGDRIIIKNIPEDYHYRHLYNLQPDGTGLGVVDMGWWGNEAPKRTNFFTGYAPYLHEGHFECSGGGNSVEFEHLTFVKTAPAPFWRFNDNQRKAHNAEYYDLPVNWFECEFKYL